MNQKTRLNKYISNSGVCSRREADKYIKAGLVSVNNKVIIEMGFKVNENDIVKFSGEKNTKKSKEGEEEEEGRRKRRRMKKKQQLPS